MASDDEFYDVSDTPEIVESVLEDATPEDLTLADPLLKKDGAGDEDWSPHNSFLADSPYFNAFVDNDVKSLSTLIDTLHDISARTKTFAKCGALMAESTRRLAYSCHLKRDNDLSEEMSEGEKKYQQEKLVKERRRALGNEMADLLQLLGEVRIVIVPSKWYIVGGRIPEICQGFQLGELVWMIFFLTYTAIYLQVLEEIASAQMNMVNVFDSTLGMSLEAFAGSEMMTVNMLKQEATQTTEASENMFFKYLNGKSAAATLGLFGSDEAPGAGGSGDQKQKNSNMLSSKFKNWRNKNQSDPTKHHSQTKAASNAPEDSSLAMATKAANLRLNLEQIRVGQANAELKRFQLLKHLVGIKHRRNFELCEGALASLHGMRTCFQQSHNVVQVGLKRE